MDETDESIKKKAHEWFSARSFIEQEYYRKEHPFFGLMSRDYFLSHSTAIVELYNFFSQ